MTPAAGRPLRVATLDARSGASERATRRALLAAGTENVLPLAASDPRRFGERAQALRDARPDVVLVAVADRGAADELVLLAEPLRFGCATQVPPPRVLLASGDDGAVARATRLLAPFPVEVTPDARTDEGRRRIVARLREMRRADGVLRDEAVEVLARRIAELRGGSALVVDVMSASTSLVRSEVSAAPLAAHARPLGTGAGADHVVARAGLDRVAAWIPWPVDRPTLLERVFNRARWPGAVATDRDAIAVEVALTHEAIAHALVDAGSAGIGAPLRSADTVLLTGALGRLAQEAAVLVAIDALEPREPSSIAIDDGDALVELAAEGVTSGDTAALDGAIRDRLAPVAAVVPISTSRRTDVRFASTGAQREERVERGAFYVLPIDMPVEVSGPGLTRARVVSGRLGLVVDARPRPLALPPRDAERVPAVRRWYEAVGAFTADATSPARPA